MGASRFLIPAMLVAVSLSAQAETGAVKGLVRERHTRKPLPGIVVRAFGEGRTIGTTVSTDRDGRFLIEGLAPGRYAVCAGAAEDRRPIVATVDVPANGETELIFQMAPSISVDGDSWVQAYPVFYQSFTATGLGISSLKLKAYGPERRVAVQLLEGEGVSGRPVGKARTTQPFGREGEAAVFWSAGEAPTEPGKRYTFRLAAEDGKTWIPGVAGKGDVYALGLAYFGPDPRPFTDIGFALCEENDGLNTNYAVSAGRRALFVRAVGQTFVARSRSIRFASASLQHAVPRAFYVRFSVHEDGPGGRQIGPSKSTTPAMDCAVAWLPDEVPVVPGRTYYLHIESYDGTEFYACVEPDLYADGEAFSDGLREPRYDLAAWIAGEISDADRDALLRHPLSERSVELVNPSFEEGLSGWQVTHPGIGAVTGCDGGVVPMWGERMFGWTNRKTGEGSRTIIYQTVEAIPGRRYSFSGGVYTDRVGGRSSDQKIRLVADPLGTARFENDTMESSQWYATEGEWRRGSVEFTAKGQKVTVGFELEQRWSLDLCSLYADAARLDLLKDSNRGSSND